jgi:cytochrome c oxidase subunit III
VSNVVAQEQPTLLSHFDDLQQQDDSTKLGMWTFLATEVMFFGGMFLAYILYRWKFHTGFAVGSNELYMWLGFFNTGVLLCSSLSMALAVDYAKLGQLRPLLINLVITMALGATFLGVKAIEYTIDYHEALIPGLNFYPTHLAKHLSSVDLNHVQLFFVLYFAMTGLHALHMVIGIVAIGVLALMIRRGKFADGTTVESLGLYWHFVDLVWVFLFPLLYLIDLNHKL